MTEEKPTKTVQLRVVDKPSSPARERADQIRSHLTDLAGHVGALADLAATAYAERDWEPLGYSSWEVYCRDQFQSDHLRIDPETRQLITARLLEQGATTRQIAPVTGVSQKQSDRDAAEVRGRIRKPRGSRNKAKTTAYGKNALTADQRAEADKALRAGRTATTASRLNRGDVERLIEETLALDLPQDERREWMIKLGEWTARFSPARK